jgi:hypothetical protein
MAYTTPLLLCLAAAIYGYTLLTIARAIINSHRQANYAQHDVIMCAADGPDLNLARYQVRFISTAIWVTVSRANPHAHLLLLMDKGTTMFTLTLHRSARVKIGQSLCGFAALVSIQNAALSADADLRVADADEVREVHSRIASIFANLDDFPEAPVSVAKLEKKLYWSGVGADAILLAPVVVHFAA